MSQQHRTWLITGCSTGLGRALAEVLIRRGETVFATARDPDHLLDLVDGHANATALKLDVTSPADIAAAVLTAVSAGGVVCSSTMPATATFPRSRKVTSRTIAPSSRRTCSG